MGKPKRRHWIKTKALAIVRRYDKLPWGKGAAWLAKRGLTTGHISYFRRRFKIK
jgi:hypothetical protein